MSYEKDKLEFYAVAGRYGLTAAACRTIIRHAQHLERSNVRQCNEPMDADEEKQQEMSDDDARGAITKALYGSNVKALFQGDPRGFAVKLKFSRGEFNSFGGEGYGVPTRAMNGG